MQKLLLRSQSAFDYFAIPNDLAHVRKYDFAWSLTKKYTYASISFDCNQDLIYLLPQTQTILEIFPWLGGWFVFLWVIAKFFAYLFMPWITYLSIVIRLFKVDPSKGQMPRDPLAVEKATP